MTIYLSICLSVCLSNCLSPCLCICLCLSVCLCLFVHVYACLTICRECLYVGMTVHLSAFLTVCLFACMFICLSVWMSAWLCICLLCLSACVSVCLSLICLPSSSEHWDLECISNTSFISCTSSMTLYTTAHAKQHRISRKPSRMWLSPYSVLHTWVNHLRTNESSTKCWESGRAIATLSHQSSR